MTRLFWTVVNRQLQTKGLILKTCTLVDATLLQQRGHPPVRWLGHGRHLDHHAAVEAAMFRYGRPEHLRSDNGPEFIAYAIQDWLKTK